MWLICPVRPGDKNEELRYAMRSWEANLHPIQQWDENLTLVIVGDKPDWCEPDVFVKGNRFSSMPLNVWDNIRLGSEAAETGETVVYMNDDFFCMDPVGAVLPVKRASTLERHIAQFAPGASNWWPVSLRLTASWLSERGFPHPDSYEVHRPLAASPSAMIEALDAWDGGFEGPIPQWRTLYGVLNGVRAYPVVDAKLGGRVTGMGTPWISTSDQTWRIYAPDMRTRFQKPSCWEKS